MRAHAVRWFLLLAAVALLSACTFTKLAYTNAALAYENAAPMLTWVVDDYLDLSASQKEWVRQRLSRAMDWHRQRELPQYRAFFQHVMERPEAPLTVAELTQAHRELYVHYHQMLERVLPDAAELLAQLDNDQVEHLQAKFEEHDRKFINESVKGALDDRRKRQAGKWIEHLESWVGRLDDEQKALVLRHVRGFADLSSDRLADTRHRQAELLRLVRTKPAREQAIAALRNLFIDTHTWRSPEYRDKLAQRERQIFEMLAELSATLTPEQRSHQLARIRGYVRDINELTAQASERPTSGT